jgi:hypothetical protein
MLPVQGLLPNADGRCDRADGAGLGIEVVRASANRGSMVPRYTTGRSFAGRPFRCAVGPGSTARRPHFRSQGSSAQPPLPGAGRAGTPSPGSGPSSFAGWVQSFPQSAAAAWGGRRWRSPDPDFPAGGIPSGQWLPSVRSLGILGLSFRSLDFAQRRQGRGWLNPKHSGSGMRAGTSPRTRQGEFECWTNDVPSTAPADCPGCSGFRAGRWATSGCLS